MYPVSQEFIDKIKADERQVFAKLQVDYTSPFLDQSISVEANETANASFPSQTADSVAEPFAKIASLDGSWVLDGTYALAPTPQEAEVKQMGWWGKQLAGTGGAFSTPYPTLTVTFFSRPITKLQAVGDSKRQEWPVDFSIRLYDGNNTLLYTETVTGNTQVAWSKTLDEPITQVEKMTLELTKWSHAGRQAKILEFFTSIQEVYEGDDIILVHLLEEREVSQGSLPVGNISANEIDIRLNNETRKFDAGNKQSPLYQTLKANRRIKAWLGVDTAEGKEYVPLGTFWSGDWHVPEDEVYAATTGRDRLELLRKSTYSTSKVHMPEKAGQDIIYTDTTFEGELDGVVVGDGVKLVLLESSNILTNPSFEGGTEGWLSTFQGGLSYWEICEDDSWHGSKAMCLPGGGTHSWRGIGQVFHNLLVGSTYTASVYIKCDAGVDYGVEIRIRTSIDGGQTWSFGAGTGLQKPTEWTRISCSYTIEENINAIQVDIFSSPGNASGKNAYIDATQFEKSKTANIFHLPGQPYYLPQGTLTKTIDISPAVTAQSSEISWTSTTPTNTSITIETALSTDRGATYSEWQTATNGATIPGITAGMDLSNARLKYRATLATTDTTVTPTLHDVTITIEPQLIPKTLYDLAENILTDAEVEEYYIDPELKDFPVPYAWFDSQSHREALRKIAEACLGQVYCDRNGIIRIEGPSFLQSQTEPVATITPGDYFRKDNPVKWSEIANYVEVETQPLRPDIEQEVYRSNEPVSISAGQSKTITAYYNHTPCIEAVATLENAVSGAEIIKATYYAWGADITVYSANTGTYELVINAKPLKVLNKEKAIAQDEESIIDNGKLRYVFPANPLVQTREVAQKIADTLLAYFKNPRRDVEVEWRGNPALLLGDKIAVGDKDEENEYFVTRQELEYTGALRARMSGRRA